MSFFKLILTISKFVDSVSLVFAGLKQQMKRKKEKSIVDKYGYKLK